MKPNVNASVDLKVGRYLLEKIKKTDEGKFLVIPEKELMEACGVRDPKQLGSIFRMKFRDMFSRMGGEVFPMFRDFDGRDGFLKHLEFTVQVLENPQGKEGRGRNFPADESGFHAHSTGSRRRL